MGCLVLVRHGETDFNVEDRFAGWTDIDINSNGQLQMERVGSVLRHLRFDEVVCSDLRRAIASRDIIIANNISIQKVISTDGHLPIYMLKELRGRNNGKLVGLNKTDTALEYGIRSAHLWRSDFNLRIPDGESLADILDRVQPVILNKFWPLVIEGNNILIITHGNTIRAILVALDLYTQDEISNLFIPSGTIAIIRPARNFKKKIYWQYIET